MTNTEKPSTKAEQKKGGLVETKIKNKANKKNILDTQIKNETQKTTKLETKENKESEKNILKEKDEEKKEEKLQHKEKKKEKIKKDFAIVDAKNVSISTKHASAICKFINNKPIKKAINELERVLHLKLAIPMKGEIPHRKGKMMSGRFPVKASKYFIKILKQLEGNSNQNNIDEPIIKLAVANKAQKPYGRFGKHQKKRSHIKLVVIEKKILKEKNKIKKKK